MYLNLDSGSANTWRIRHRSRSRLSEEYSPAPPAASFFVKTDQAQLKILGSAAGLGLPFAPACAVRGMQSRMLAAGHYPKTACAKIALVAINVVNDILCILIKQKPPDRSRLASAGGARMIVIDSSYVGGDLLRHL